jgi:hypothetical protein
MNANIRTEYVDSKGHVREENKMAILVVSVRGAGAGPALAAFPPGPGAARPRWPPGTSGSGAAETGTCASIPWLF